MTQLTMAQQHAEELLEFVNSVACWDHEPLTLRAKSRALLDKIKPPEPPTLEEALAALAQAAEGLDEFDSPERYKQTHGILDRARRAGVFKP